jgi:hypothetical protein
MLHLSDDESYQYNIKPNNPNLLIGHKNNNTVTTTTVTKKGEKEPSTKKIKTVEPLHVPEKKSSDKEVKDLENRLTKKFKIILQPLYECIHMISAESGKTIYYRYDTSISNEQKKIPIVWGCKDKKEFIEKNEHIKDYVYEALYEDLYKPASVMINTAPNSPKKKQQQQPNNNDPLSQSTELTEFNIIGSDVAEHLYDSSTTVVPPPIGRISIDPIISFVLDNYVYGALEMAAEELGYPLTDLILSKDVRTIFCQFVARKFVSTTTVAAASGISNGTAQYRIYSGIHMKQQDTKWLLGAKLFFQTQVYYEEIEKKVDLEKKLLEELKNVREQIIEVTGIQVQPEEILTDERLTSEVEQEDDGTKLSLDILLGKRRRLATELLYLQTRILKKKKRII